MGDSGKERKRYGHDFPLFALETVEFIPVDNMSLIIHVLSVFPTGLCSTCTCSVSQSSRKFDFVGRQRRK